MVIAAGRYAPIKKIIDDNRRFLLTGHEHPDGDVAGSEMALYHVLIALGKEVWVANGFPVPDSYRFLPGIEAAKTEPPPWRPDVAVFCDSSELARVGEKLLPAVTSAPIIVSLDHHSGNRVDTPYKLVDTDAASTGMVIFRFLQETGLPINRAVAAAVYMTLVTDTGNFRQANTTAETLRLASALVDTFGIVPHEVYSQVFERNSMGKLRLMARLYASAGESADGRVLSVDVPRALHKELGTTDEDLEGLIDFGKTVEQVRAVAFFRELGNGAVKINMRAKPGVDVLKVCQQFGGGGHVLAAGCTVQGTIQQVRAQVLPALDRAAINSRIEA